MIRKKEIMEPCVDIREFTVTNSLRNVFCNPFFGKPNGVPLLNVIDMKHPVQFSNADKVREWS